MRVTEVLNMKDELSEIEGILPQHNALKSFIAGVLTWQSFCAPKPEKRTRAE